MFKPKPATSNPCNKLSTRRCDRCDKPYQPRKHNSKYCGDRCKRGVEVAKRPKTQNRSKLVKLQSTYFFQYLARECQRAGTVEILQGHTGESLRELLVLSKFARSANGFPSLKKFELGHIAAVAGEGRTGLLHALNLVLVPLRYNRQQGTKSYCDGLYILTADLQPKWQVVPNSGLKEVVELIVDYLGEDFCHRFRIDNKLSTDKEHKREELVKTIMLHPKYAGDDLIGKSTTGLQRLLDELNGKSAWCGASTALSVEFVLEVELERHALTSPRLVPVVEWYRAYREHRSRPTKSDRHPKQIKLSEAFDGAVINHLFDVVMGKDFQPNEVLAPLLRQECSWITTHRRLLQNVFTEFCQEHLGKAPVPEWGLRQQRDGSYVWEQEAA